MSVTPTTTLPSITVRASQLRDLLAPVLPIAASAPFDLPVLCGVLLQVRGGDLTALATDRFRAAMTREPLAPLGEDDEPAAPDQAFRALVAVPDLRRVLTWFKPTRADDPVLLFTLLSADELQVTQLGAFAGLVGAQLRFRPLEGRFPDIEKILRDALAADPQAEPMSLNPAFLSDFRLAARDGRPLILRAGAKNKPALVHCGDHFIGLIMPRRDHAPAAAMSDLWPALLEPAPRPTPALTEAVNL